MIAIFLWMSLEVAAPEVASKLPPEARVHNARGMALAVAGDLEGGIAELERAYAAMPDPVKYRAGRGSVVGSLRSALRQRYELTGALSDLCRLRAVLQRHRDELLAALGQAGSAADVAGTDGLIREIDVELAGRACSEPARPAEATQAGADESMPTDTEATPPTAPVEAPPNGPAPLHPEADAAPRYRRLRGPGGALLGVGGLAAIGSAVAAGIYGDRYLRLDALDRWLADQDEVAEKERLHHEGRQARTAAIVTGAAAAALIVAGVAVLVHGSRRTARRVSAAPSLAPGFWGLHVQGRF